MSTGIGALTIPNTRAGKAFSDRANPEDGPPPPDILTPQDLADIDQFNHLLPDDPILLFSGPYRFLSNFWIEPDRTCVEVEYQAGKCEDPDEAALFARLGPYEAKRLGKLVKLLGGKEGWDEIKEGVMGALVRQKFADHAGLAEALLLTGERAIVHGNWWGCWEWGVTENGRGVGHNKLGIILMLVRAEIREGQL